jgi:putative agrB-like protein
MVKKICMFLVNRIKKEMPDISSEREEAIEYGLELIVGELPKMILLVVIAFILKIGWLVICAYFTMLPYKITAGGFHLKTHIGCTIGTLIIYYGNVLLSQRIIIEPIYIKYTVIIALWIISIIMISLYAPADTINLPILRRKERRLKKILAYIFMTVTLVFALIIKNNTISNILIFNTLIETICITKIAYKLTKNQYGYKTYKLQGEI